MFGNLTDILAQAQKMRGEMQKIQETLGNRTVEVAAGAGMIKVVANGKQEILSVTIDPELLKMGDRAMLQDLVTAGVNQAIKASQAMVTEEMTKLTAGLGPLASLLKGLGG